MAAVYHCVFNWCSAGCDVNLGRRLRVIRAALLERVLPGDGDGPRTHGWWYACTVLSVIELVMVSRTPGMLEKCRMPWRCLAPVVQKCLWTNDFCSSDWHTGVHYLLGGLHPERLVSDAALAAVYVVVDRQSGCFYIGKTKAVRQYGRGPWHGVTLRFQEHMLASFVPTHGARDGDNRYGMWRRSHPHHMLILACWWADDQTVATLEPRLIRAAQPTTQKTFTSRTRVRPEGRRPWPRFRQAPTASSEVGSNCWVAMFSVR